MVSLSSIREFCVQYAPELKRYGTTALIALAAMYKGLWPLAGLILFIAVPIMYAYGRWGRPWQQKGAQIIFKPKNPNDS